MKTVVGVVEKGITVFEKNCVGKQCENSDGRPVDTTGAEGFGGNEELGDYAQNASQATHEHEHMNMGVLLGVVFDLSFFGSYQEEGRCQS